MRPSQPAIRWSDLTSKETAVLREGRRYTLPVDKLVVGDIVDVKFGDRVPADIRMIQCSGFKVLTPWLCVWEAVN